MLKSVEKCRDTRELVRLVCNRIYIEPLVDDLLIRIVPGLLLLVGFVVVTKGYTLTTDIIDAFFTWKLFLIALFVAWLTGFIIHWIGRAVGYELPYQPDGWAFHAWIEAVELDFENRASLAVRRATSRARIAGQLAIAFGTVLGILLAVYFVELVFDTPAILRWHRVIGWTLLVLFALLVLRIVHRVYRQKWHGAILQVVSQPAARSAHRLRPEYLGQQSLGEEDRDYRGSLYREVKQAAFANPYYTVWGLGGEERLPVYEVTLASVLRGILPCGTPYQFREAAIRTVESQADLRWGADRRGYRRLLHPNGVCLFGTWEITEDSPYSGYFQQGSRGLIVGRYSTCCTETRRNRRRSLSLVGRIYPTLNPHHGERLPTASFITQEDIGGETREYINDAECLNAPNTSAWRRGLGPNGLPVISITGLLFKCVDVEEAVRQLYEIAELGKPANEPTKAPKFMRLTVSRDQPRVGGRPDLDFRDEVLAHIYDHGDPTPRRDLVFDIEVTDEGGVSGPAFFIRRTFSGWRRIGRIVFTEGVASYNGDHVVHMHHPAWRENRNNPNSVHRTTARSPAR